VDHFTMQEQQDLVEQVVVEMVVEALQVEEMEQLTQVVVVEEHILVQLLVQVEVV